ncbi:MAG TPA: FAD-dependent oxidoreductase, partial [Nitrospira sp.]|nr:FAD-dependent oxidoreductase [Nitrospira sp.]
INSLIKSGAILMSHAPAVRFEFDDNRMTGVRLRDGNILHAHWYVSAIPPTQLTPLLPERWLTRYAYFQHIVDLNNLPCTQIHVQSTAILPTPRHILLNSGPFPWITCMPSSGDRHVIARLATLHDRAVADAEQQVSSVLRSLNLLGTENRLTSFSQQETKSAILSLAPGAKVRRPIQQSPVSNLLLAGAWTDTGWPANLESAIVSGERCAEIIMEHGSARV